MTYGVMRRPNGDLEVGEQDGTSCSEMDTRLRQTKWDQMAIIRYHYSHLETDSTTPSHDFDANLTYLYEKEDATILAIRKHVLVKVLLIMKIATTMVWNISEEKLKDSTKNIRHFFFFKWKIYKLHDI